MLKQISHVQANWLMVPAVPEVAIFLNFDTCNYFTGVQSADLEMNYENVYEIVLHHLPPSMVFF